MAKNIEHIQHIKSNVVENGIPKLPNPSALTEGEIAINYAEGYETISIKNSSGNISTFVSVWDRGTGANSAVLKGGNNIASGANSVAEGSGTTASGNYSHAEGLESSATSTVSHAEGKQTIASGYSSHAEGSSTKANGNSSHAEGYGTTASSYYSHAEGSSTIASGECSHAEGNSTTASSSYSHAEGQYTKASGSISHAEGYSTTANGACSHAEGSVTKASGNNSHAEGYETSATSEVSHAEGRGTQANGTHSHAEGYYTVANNKSEHASGQYNVSSKTSTTFGNSGNTLFSVGNGTSTSARHNAFEVRQNGDIYITSGSSDIRLQDCLNDTTYSAGTAAQLSAGTNTYNGIWSAKNIKDGIDKLYAFKKELTNEDLNDVLEPGFYNAGGGNTCTNKPTDITSFGLQVIHTAVGKYYEQIIYQSALNNSYRRACSNGTWGDWVKDEHVNQNAFSNVKVGSITIAADTTTDTIEISAGSFVSLTPDATNDKLTIGVSTGTTSSTLARGDHSHSNYVEGSGLTVNNIVLGNGASTIKASTYGVETTVSPTLDTKIPTSKAIATYVTSQMTSVLTYKGTVNKNADLPATHKVGDVYVVASAGTYVGKTCEVGDYIICKKAGTAASAADWDVINGENQVENKGASLAAAGSSATIATVDGTNLTITTPSTWTGVAKTGTVTKITTASGLTGGDIITGGTIGLAATGTAGTYGPTANVTGTEGTTIKIPQITTDAYGRVTSVTERTLTNKNSTYTVNNGTFTISGNGTSVASTSANASANSGLNIKSGSNVTITTSTNEITIAATDTKYTAATAAPGKVASASASGTSTNYARQDHTHGIDLATGDSNGQVKIAGTNVSVKGLGTAAYQASGYFAVSGHTHSAYVPTGRTITAASGLTGGGNLSANRTIGLATTGTAGTYYRVVTDEYGRVISGNTADANTNYYTSGLTVTTATTSTTITVHGNNAAVKGTAVIPAATSGAAGVMTSTDKTKLDGIAEGANKYVHPTTSGNKHVPSGGSSGKFLGWSSDGTAAWVNSPNTDTKVIQSSSTTSSYRGILMGENTNANPNSGINSSVTSQTYVTNNLTVQPSTGNIVSKGSLKGTQLISSVATGTAPLSVASTTKVTNLNADYLDGNDVAWFMKRGVAYTASKSGTFYQKVATTTISSTGTHDASITLLVSSHYTNGGNGILNVVCRKDSGAVTANTSGTYAKWVSNDRKIDNKSFILTFKCTNSSASTWNLYCKQTGTWMTSRFTMLDEGSWYGKSSTWTLLTASGGTPNGYTAIPSDETQFVSSYNYMEANYYVSDATGTAGTSTNRTIWNGKILDVKSLYTGLRVDYKLPVSGASAGCTLNINSLGEHPVVINSASLVTTHYPVGTILPLIYDADASATITANSTSSSITGTWKVAEYGTSYSTGTAALLTAGTNTTNRVWSAKVLRDGLNSLYKVSAGRAINVTNNVISLNLPISAGTGTNSIIEGYYTTASGNYGSHAEGNNTTASGESSHAEGFGTKANGNYSHAEGDSTTASGTYSHAEGGDTIASGTYSHAEGEGTKASGGFASHAEGRSTIASGATSHAEGGNTMATNSYSHAEGHDTIASGNSSHAEGSGTTAGGSQSHAEGINTHAIGPLGSHAEGSGTTASGECSHAEGQETTASGDYSHSEGENTIASGEDSHAEGYGTIASGIISHAEGQETTASGDCSHAEGYDTIASGETSHAEGEGTKAIGNYSHAEGNDAIASGNSSHAEGNNTKANGSYSHAEGYRTIANGNYGSHAEGQHTTASGNRSHAEGFYTVTKNQSEHASGQYNVSSSASTTFGVSGNTLFSVGNGTSDSARHNAFEIRQNGLSYMNGNVQVSGTVSQVSDERLKNIIEDKELLLEEIVNAPLVSYTFKGVENDSPHIGTIAQYWLDILPEVVCEYDSEENNLSLDYSSLNVAIGISLAKIIKKQSIEIDSLKEEITQLKQNIGKIE
jgi:hypothetical protein